LFLAGQNLETPSASPQTVAPIPLNISKSQVNKLRNK
jgi:hypothetical protein